MLLSACQFTSANDNKQVVNNAPVQDIGIVTSFDEIKKLYTANSDTAYMVNFWATWCKPCVVELPYFNTVSKELKGKKIKFIFVCLDFINTVENKVKPFLIKNPLEGYVVVLGDQNVNTWGSEIDNKWDGAIPVSMLITKDKKATRLGSFADADDLRKFIHLNMLNN